MRKQLLFIACTLLCGCDYFGQNEQSFAEKYLFFDMETENQDQPCTIQGAVPNWLAGTLLRNGPAKFTVGDQRVESWFDGLAMIHAFEFTSNGVLYTNRFLRSNQYHEWVEEGKFVFSGFAQNTEPSGYKSPANEIHNADVSIANYAEKLVALTETPLPVVFDRRTVETIGNFAYQDNLPKSQVFESAHPLHDIPAQETINYITKFAEKSSYIIWRMQDGIPTRDKAAEIPVEFPSYMHSFALTEHYVILVEYPFVVDPVDIMRGNKPFIRNFKWMPERGTNFLVIDRSTGQFVMKFTAEPFFAWHHVNAFDLEDNIYLDIVAYPNAYTIDFLTEKESASNNLLSNLRRFVLSIDTKKLSEQIVFSQPLELPRVPASLVAHQYRYCYAVDARYPTSLDDQRMIYKIDMGNKTNISWSEAGCAPGEPIFVPMPGGKNEDDGAILSLVLDYAHHRSFLLILNAKDFTELARAETPHAIPIGLHGLWKD